MMYSVLIVDDEERIRKGLERIVDWDALGFSHCESAASGREAIEIVRHRSPDLIIADLNMPGINGIAMLTQLRAEGFAGQFIIVSGVTDFHSAKDAIDLKVATYLLKPVDESLLLSKISELFPLPEAQSEPSPHDIVQRVENYIKRHYAEPIKLNTIAEAFHYSAPHLGRLFKKATGMSFHDYLAKIRIHQAKKLLSEGQKVYVAAKMTGYTNLDYFAILFKEHVGMTPNEYKRSTSKDSPS